MTPDPEARMAELEAENATQRDIRLTRYRDLLAAGLAANPRLHRAVVKVNGDVWHSRPPATCSNGWRNGRMRCSPSQGDLMTIPFDNHQAERNLRGRKVHQNVSDCFRSNAGADAFACLRGRLLGHHAHARPGAACHPRNGLHWPAALS